jgi:hypothetical protein
MKVLDLSFNKLRSLPQELGKLKQVGPSSARSENLAAESMCRGNGFPCPRAGDFPAQLKELLLHNNMISAIPFEMGRLFQLDVFSAWTLPRPPFWMPEVAFDSVMLMTYVCVVCGVCGAFVVCGAAALRNNPLSEPLQSYAAEGTDAVLSYLLDNAPSTRVPCKGYPGLLPVLPPSPLSSSPGSPPGAPLDLPARH